MTKTAKKKKSFHVLHLHCDDAKVSDLYSANIEDAVEVLESWFGDNCKWKDNEQRQVTITVEKMTQSKWVDDMEDAVLD